MADTSHHHYPRRRLGFALGIAAILCWASAGAAASWLGKNLGLWPTLTIACGIGGLAQLACYLAMGHSVRATLLPPAKLWGIILLGFPLYEFAHVAALTGSASETQTVGVNLINYLWPTLTVLFAVMWVPGTRGSMRLGVAAAVALAGVAVGNWRGVETVFGWNGAARLPLTPYLLVFVAAVAWAVYSALLSRWRAWADQYSTATPGFLAVSLVAGVVATVRGDWRPLSPVEWLVAVLAGLVIYAAGYMLWELAIHRAPAEKLGLLSGAVPILSTLCLYAMFSLTHSGNRADPSDILRQLAAAALIAGAVLISMLPAKRSAA
jgi:drug/metabolite transporter (DMT)-like permease